MANEKQLSILKQGVEVWNEWRKANPDITVDLSNANLMGENLVGADLKMAKMSGSWFDGAKLDNADLSGANISKAQFFKASLMETDLTGANLRSANLKSACLNWASLIIGDLRQADFSNALLIEADLNFANLSKTIFMGATLTGANLTGADLRKADLRHANLCDALLVKTHVEGAKISNSLVYGVSVWDLDGNFAEQEDLNISSPDNISSICVDNIELAQFVYLVLNDKKIRGLINLPIFKSVLILGRFAFSGREAVLDALRKKLRKYRLLPIIVDFDRPLGNDYPEKIKTLVDLSYFVIFDITNPKSPAFEFQRTIPDFEIPLIPIIQEGEQPFPMMVNLQEKYNCISDTFSYNSLDMLIKSLRPSIINLAIQKRNDLNPSR